MRILKLLALLCIQIVISVASIIAVFTFYDVFSGVKNLNHVDPLSLANTFIVFVTFIVVVATIAITIGIIFYTKQYSQNKENLLSENLQEVVKALATNRKAMNEIINGIFNNKIISDQIDKRLKSQMAFINEKINFQDEEIVRIVSSIEDKIRNEFIQIEKRNEAKNKIKQTATTSNLRELLNKLNETIDKNTK